MIVHAKNARKKLKVTLKRNLDHLRTINILIKDC